MYDPYNSVIMVDRVILVIIEELRKIIETDPNKGKYTKLVNLIGYHTVDDFLKNKMEG